MGPHEPHEIQQGQVQAAASELVQSHISAERMNMLTVLKKIMRGYWWMKIFTQSVFAAQEANFILGCVKSREIR